MRHVVTASLALAIFVSFDASAIAGKKAKARADRGSRQQCGESTEISMPPVCGSQSKECGPCHSYPACCDAGGEGIDMESLTPAAQSKKLYEAYQARILFELPEDVTVHLMDVAMSTPGEKRSFVVPVYDQKKTYEYEVRVDAVRNGKKYFRKVKIKEFRAGMIVKVAVEAPPVPEGEPVVLNAAAEVVAPGGLPEDDKKEEKQGEDQGDVISLLPSLPPVR